MPATLSYHTRSVLYNYYTFSDLDHVTSLKLIGFESVLKCLIIHVNKLTEISQIYVVMIKRCDIFILIGVNVIIHGNITL